jgi:hypothetical protein
MEKAASPPLVDTSSFEKESESDTVYQKQVEQSLWKNIEHVTKNPIQATLDVFYILCSAYGRLLAKDKKNHSILKEMTKRLLTHLQSFSIHANVESQRDAIQSVNSHLEVVQQLLKTISDELNDTTRYSVPSSSSSSSSASHSITAAVAFAINEKEKERGIDVRQASDLLALSALRSTNQPVLWKHITDIAVDLFSPMVMASTTTYEPTNQSGFLYNREAYYKSPLSVRISSLIRKMKENKEQRTGSDLMLFTRYALQEKKKKTEDNELRVREFIRDYKLKQTLHDPPPSSSSSLVKRRIRTNNEKEAETTEKETEGGTIMDPLSVLIHRLHQYSLYGKTKKQAHPLILYSSPRFTDENVKWSQEGIRVLIEFLESYEDRSYSDLLPRIISELKNPPLPPVTVVSVDLTKVEPTQKEKKKKKNKKKKEENVKKEDIQESFKPFETLKDLPKTLIETSAFNSKSPDESLPVAAAAAANPFTTGDKTFIDTKDAQMVLESQFSSDVKQLAAAARSRKWLILSKRKESEKEEENVMERYFAFCPSLLFNRDQLKKQSENVLCPRFSHHPFSLKKQLETEIQKEAACLTSEYADNDRAFEPEEESRDHRSSQWNRRLIFTVYYALKELVEYYATYVFVDLSKKMPEENNKKRIKTHRLMGYHPFSSVRHSQSVQDSFMQSTVEERVRVYGYWLSMIETLEKTITKKVPMDKSLFDDDINTLLVLFPMGNYSNHPLSSSVQTWGQISLSPTVEWEKRLQTTNLKIVEAVYQRYCHSFILQFMCDSKNHLMNAFDQSVNHPWNSILKYLIEVDTTHLYGPSAHFLGMKLTTGNRLSLSESFPHSSPNEMIKYLPQLTHLPSSFPLTKIWDWMSIQFQLSAITHRLYGYVALFHSRSHLDEWLFSSHSATVDEYVAMVDTTATQMISFLSSQFMTSDQHTKTIGKKTPKKVHFIQPILDKLGQTFPTEYVNSKIKTTGTNDERTQHVVARRWLGGFIHDILKIGSDLTFQKLQLDDQSLSERARWVEHSIFVLCMDFIQRSFLMIQTLQKKLHKETTTYMIKELPKIKLSFPVARDIRKAIHGGVLNSALRILYVHPQTKALDKPNDSLNTLLLVSSGKQVWTGGLIRPSSSYAEYQLSLKHIYSCIRDSVSELLMSPSPLL